MGVNHSSLNPEVRNGGGLKIDRQIQKGSVVARKYRKLGYVKATITFFSGIRQTADPPATVNICANGTFFYGSAAPPASTIRELSQAFKDPPVDVGLRDSKAHQLLIAYSRGWYAIPAPVNFTRHAGTCLVIGDKNTPSAVHEIQVGDCFRLGSVGLVVVSMRLGDGSEQQINPKRLACLQEESLGNFGDDEDEAFRAIDERKSRVRAGSTRTLVDEGNNADEESSADAPLCYMCYDPHDTADDPLVAPCDCKGDTRYLHVSCLQNGIKTWAVAQTL